SRSQKYARGTPTRTPCSPAVNAPWYSPRGTGSVAQSAGSAPAMAANTSAASSTVRARGPTVSKERASGTTPALLTRPWLVRGPGRGRSATAPQQTAVSRTKQAVSPPTAATATRPATAAPEPLLEPHGTCTRLQGLRVGP